MAIDRKVVTPVHLTTPRVTCVFNNHMPVVQLSVVRVAQVHGIDPGSAAQVEDEMGLLVAKAAPDVGVRDRGAVEGGSVRTSQA